LEDYNQALNADSLFTSALFNRAFTFKLMGDFNQALSDANRIVEIDPETPEHWNLKGNIHLLFGDYYDAVAAYNQAIDLRPDYSEALFNRGLANLMSYAISAGCSDLRASLYAGYERAEEYMELFCSP
jgi:tetratricopeptide (TPR) repeat protein